MGWLISIPLFIVMLLFASKVSIDAVLIASGLFAIAGSIGFGFASVKELIKKKD